MLATEWRDDVHPIVPEQRDVTMVLILPADGDNALGDSASLLPGTLHAINVGVAADRRPGFSAISDMVAGHNAPPVPAANPGATGAGNKAHQVGDANMPYYESAHAAGEVQSSRRRSSEPRGDTLASGLQSRDWARG